MNILILSPKVTEWEETHLQCFSLKEHLDEDGLEAIRKKIVDTNFNIVYLGTKQENLTIDNYALSLLIAEAKDLTKQIIAGNKMIPPLEELKKSSRIICTVVHSLGKKLYICVPIHHYHAWSSLEDNTLNDEEKLLVSIMRPGSLHIRLANEDELNELFVTFQQFGGVPMLTTYQPILAEKLKDNIYAH